MKRVGLGERCYSPLPNSAAIALAAWREKTVQELRGFYSDGSLYGSLTQLEHGLQAAFFAKKAGCDDSTIVAALLHDVGWKMARSCDRIEGGEFNATAEDNSLASQYGILSCCGNTDADLEQQQAQHDVIGGTFLRMRGFTENVPHLVEGHVLAKRYLCWKEADYFSKLSPSSVKTLGFQGGKMTADEAAYFESDPLFQMCLQMRRWDEGAKIVGLEVPGWETYEDTIKNCIMAAPCKASDTKGFYIRDGNTIVGIRDESTEGPADAEASPKRRKKS